MMAATAGSIKLKRLRLTSLTYFLHSSLSPLHTLTCSKLPVQNPRQSPSSLSAYTALLTVPNPSVPGEDRGVSSARTTCSCLISTKSASIFTENSKSDALHSAHLSSPQNLLGLSSSKIQVEERGLRRCGFSSSSSSSRSDNVSYNALLDSPWLGTDFKGLGFKGSEDVHFLESSRGDICWNKHNTSSFVHGDKVLRGFFFQGLGFKDLVLLHSLLPAARARDETLLFVDRNSRMTSILSRFRSIRLKASDPSESLHRTWRSSSTWSRTFSSAAAERAVDDGEENNKVPSDQESVLEYLQSQGIGTSDLAEVELPKSVDIVKERLEFLTKKIGLSIKDINDYPLMIGCSVKKNLIPVLNYLETNKVTPKAFPILIRKYPQVLHSSVAIDLAPNIRYIQGLGVELKQIGSVLTRYPECLGFRIEGTMSTSIAYLVMIGVSARQIGPILTEKPDIMGMRVSNNIKPKVEFISSWGIPQLIVGKMIENRPHILGFDLNEKMRPAVEALLEFGIRKEAIPQVLVQFPDILGMNVKDKLAQKLPWLIAKVGVSKESIPRALERIPQILVMNVPMGSQRADFLRSLGFSKSEVGEMVASCPQLLGLSIKLMKPNSDFLVREMKRDIRELLKYPEYLTYSLEGRIRPRYENVKEKGVEYPLAWMLNCSDAKFEERLMAGHTEIQDDVEVLFVGAGRLQVKEEVFVNESTAEEDTIKEKRIRPSKSAKRDLKLLESRDYEQPQRTMRNPGIQRGSFDRMRQQFTYKEQFDQAESPNEEDMDIRRRKHLSRSTDHLERRGYGRPESSQSLQRQSCDRTSQQLREDSDESPSKETAFSRRSTPLRSTLRDQGSSGRIANSPSTHRWSQHETHLQSKKGMGLDPGDTSYDADIKTIRGILTPVSTMRDLKPSQDREFEDPTKMTSTPNLRSLIHDRTNLQEQKKEKVNSGDLFDENSDMHWRSTPMPISPMRDLKSSQEKEFEHPKRITGAPTLRPLTHDRTIWPEKKEEEINSEGVFNEENKDMHWRGELSLIRSTRDPKRVERLGYVNPEMMINSSRMQKMSQAVTHPQAKEKQDFDSEYQFEEKVNPPRGELSPDSSTRDSKRVERPGYVNPEMLMNSSRMQQMAHDRTHPQAKEKQGSNSKYLFEEVNPPPRRMHVPTDTKPVENRVHESSKVTTSSPSMQRLTGDQIGVQRKYEEDFEIDEFDIDAFDNEDYFEDDEDTDLAPRRTREFKPTESSRPQRVTSGGSSVQRTSSISRSSSEEIRSREKRPTTSSSLERWQNLGDGS